MKFFVIADADTVLGFRYAGISGRAVREVAEARAALEEAVAAEDVGVLIITDAIAEMIREDVDHIRFQLQKPTVVELPGPGGPVVAKRPLLDLVREALGIRI